MTSVPIALPTPQSTGRGFNIHSGGSSETEVDGILSNSGEYTDHSGPSLLQGYHSTRSGQHPVSSSGKMTRYDMCRFQFQQTNFGDAHQVSSRGFLLEYYVGGGTGGDLYSCRP